MNKITSKLLTELLETVKDAKRFTLKQAPAICREIVTLGRVTNTLMTFTGIIITIATIIAITLIYNRYGLAAFIIGLLPGIGGLVMTGQYAESMLMAWIAPKTYIIKYLNNLTNNE